MGSEYYGKMWVATCADLQNIVLREKVTRVSKLEKCYLPNLTRTFCLAIQ